MSVNPDDYIRWLDVLHQGGKIDDDTHRYWVAVVRDDGPHVLPPHLLFGDNFEETQRIYRMSVWRGKS